jgi:hypothetical protein
MMHGREKSDAAIVAGKPTNKAVSTAAESVVQTRRREYPPTQWLKWIGSPIYYLARAVRAVPDLTATSKQSLYRYWGRFQTRHTDRGPPQIKWPQLAAGAKYDEAIFPQA